MKSKYQFIGENNITACFVSGEFIWIAFFGENNISILYKSSVYNPNTRYWSISVTADEIKSIIEDSTYLYLSIDYSTNIGAKITKSSPSSISYFVTQSGINEESVDLIDDATYVYFLTPGIASGENAKICKYNKSTRAFVETIDLTTVTNAKKLDIDNAGVLWVQSDLDTSVPKLTKVEYSGSWSFTTYNLT